MSGIEEYDAIKCCGMKEFERDLVKGDLSSDARGRLLELSFRREPEKRREGAPGLPGMRHGRRPEPNHTASIAPAESTGCPLCSERVLTTCRIKPYAAPIQ